MTTVLDVQRFKEEHRRFAMLTAYDFHSARILDEAGIPVSYTHLTLPTICSV